MTEKENKLTITNSDALQAATPELGKALHDEAIQRENKRRQDIVINELQRLEQNRIDYAHKAEFATNASNWYADKLEAVKDGKFMWDRATGTMLFQEERFNRANY